MTQEHAIVFLDGKKSVIDLSVSLIFGKDYFLSSFYLVQFK